MMHLTLRRACRDARYREIVFSEDLSTYYNADNKLRAQRQLIRDVIEKYNGNVKYYAYRKSDKPYTAEAAISNRVRATSLSNALHAS
jgi:hypothetical protein